MDNKSYLIVVAHPDDEVLGAGATIDKLTKSGNVVNVCIMSGKAEARSKNSDDLTGDIMRSQKLLGISNNFIGTFPNIKFNIVPHLELVQFIEKAIVESHPDVIVTHHPADTNDDHVQTSLACQEAFRIFQRNPGIKAIEQLLLMEVLSATEWSVNASIQKFQPNYFVQVGEKGVNAKIRALGEYKGVMRDYPHPRSVETIKALATFRGSQSGLDYAEAFQLVFHRLK